MGLFPYEQRRFDYSTCGWCGLGSDCCVRFDSDCHKKNKVCINDVELSFNYIVKHTGIHYGILYPRYRHREDIDKWKKSIGEYKKITFGDTAFCSAPLYKLKWEDIPAYFKKGRTDIVVKVPKISAHTLGWWADLDIYSKPYQYQMDCPNCEKFSLAKLSPREIDDQGVVIKGEYYCNRCSFGGILKLEGFQK